MKLYLIPLAIILIIRCGPMPEPRPTSECKRAEQNIAFLECRDQAGNPMWRNKKGETFAQICERVMVEGMVPLNPECIAAASSCDEVKQCPNQ